MSEALQIVISDDQRTALALAISQSGQLPQKLDAMADQFGVGISDLINLLNEPAFIQQVRAVTKAQANLTFHSLAVGRLVDIISNGKDKTALGAINTLGRLSGDLIPHKKVDVRLTFEDLRKRESTGDPLGSLFDIRTDVIEAEVREAADEYEEWEAGQ